MSRKGAVNWDTCQVTSILANKHPGPAYHADCKLIRDVWEVVAHYYKDPCVYDDVPEADLNRCEEYIGKELLNAFLDIPGMVMAGGAAVPDITKDQIGDIDFFYQKGPIHHEDVLNGLVGRLMDHGSDIKDLVKKTRFLLVKYGFCDYHIQYDKKNSYVTITRTVTIGEGRDPFSIYDRSYINVIILTQPTSVPCIASFFMDYQQVMF